MRQTEKNDVAPPGMEHVVKALKKNPKVENPYAVAWSMADNDDDTDPVLGTAPQTEGAKVEAPRMTGHTGMANTYGQRRGEIPSTSESLKAGRDLVTYPNMDDDDVLAHAAKVLDDSDEDDDAKKADDNDVKKNDEVCTVGDDDDDDKYDEGKSPPAGDPAAAYAKAGESTEKAAIAEDLNIVSQPKPTDPPVQKKAPLGMSKSRISNPSV